MRLMLIAVAMVATGLAGAAQAQSPSLAPAPEAAPAADYMKWKGNKGQKVKYVKVRGPKHTPYGWTHNRGRKVGWTKRGGPKFSIRF